MGTTSTKAVREDWRFFNEAAELRAGYLKGLVVPRPAPTPPRPPADWLRRGLGIAVVVLALGMRPLVPTTSVAAAPFPVVPKPALSDPDAKVVYNYTLFTKVKLDELQVESGWNFNNSTDTQPSWQFCHVFTPPPGSIGDYAALVVTIASTKAGVIPYDAIHMAPLTREQYDRALKNCVWAPSTELSGKHSSDARPPEPAAAATVSPGRSEIKLSSSGGGTFIAPVVLNGTTTVYCMVDSGASDLSLSADTVVAMVQSHSLSRGAIGQMATYTLADGHTSENRQLVLSTVSVGGHIQQNVAASSAPAGASCLLGQSFLGRFRHWSIDNARGVLALE